MHVLSNLCLTNNLSGLRQADIKIGQVAYHKIALVVPGHSEPDETWLIFVLREEDAATYHVTGSARILELDKEVFA